jgi:hypothetical protein
MASKNTPPKKKASASKTQVKIELGTLKPTKAQIARLKSYVSNLVLTWVTDDVKAAPMPITCIEGGGPGGGGNGDDNGNGKGDGGGNAQAKRK